MKYIARCNNNFVNHPQHIKCTFGTCKTIDYHFDATDKNYAKAPEYQSMEKTDHWSAEYLGLPKSNLCHHFKSPAIIPDREGSTCKPEKSCDPVNGISKYSQGGQ